MWKPSAGIYQQLRHSSWLMSDLYCYVALLHSFNRTKRFRECKRQSRLSEILWIHNTQKKHTELVQYYTTEPQHGEARSSELTYDTSFIPTWKISLRLDISRACSQRRCPVGGRRLRSFRSGMRNTAPDSRRRLRQSDSETWWVEHQLAGWHASAPPRWRPSYCWQCHHAAAGRVSSPIDSRHRLLTTLRPHLSHTIVLWNPYTHIRHATKSKNFTAQLVA